MLLASGTDDRGGDGIPAEQPGQGARRHQLTMIRWSSPTGRHTQTRRPARRPQIIRYSLTGDDLADTWSTDHIGGSVRFSTSKHVCGV